MTKVYDIKIKDLEDLLKLLQSHSSDPSVAMDVVRLSDYIKRLKNQFKSASTTSIFEQIEDDLEYLDFFKPFYPVTQKFANIGKSMDEIDQPINYSSVLMSDEQVMQDVEEFYSQQGGTFYSYFLEFKEEACDHLKFIDESPNIEGETLFVKSVGEAFVFSTNYSNITKFTILVHEIQHVLDFYLNDNFSEQYIIRETMAMFMEMIATDFIAKKYKLDGEAFKRFQFIHSAVKSQAQSVVNKTNILDNARKHNGCHKSLLAKLHQLGYDSNELEFYFEQDITTDYAYPVSYLIAIELYLLYYKNKGLVIKICEDIVENGNSDNIFELLAKYDIELTNNIESFENRIYKKR